MTRTIDQLLAEPMMAKIKDLIWRHQASGYNLTSVNLGPFLSRPRCVYVSRSRDGCLPRFLMFPNDTKLQTLLPHFKKQGWPSSIAHTWRHFSRYWRFVRGIHRWPCSFYVFFDLRLNKRLNKQSRRQWFSDAITLMMKFTAKIHAPPDAMSASYSANVVVLR